MLKQRTCTRQDDGGDGGQAIDPMNQRDNMYGASQCKVIKHDLVRLSVDGCARRRPHLPQIAQRRNNGPLLSPT
jgi:hypothetical protein